MSAPIGIMGGTFDPVHFGHLRLAQEAAEILGLERVRWVPDDAEIRQTAPGYTVETLERLRRGLGAQRSIVLLLGTDAFRNLVAWERWRGLFDLAHIFVAQRPGHSLTPGGMAAALAAEWRKRAGTPDVLIERPAGSIVTYGTTALDISASAIRAHFAQARSPRYLLPSAVHDYIETHGLYTKEGSAS